MIITQTPLRISFFGGGTDYPTWIKMNGGAVLSTSINKYSYLHVRRLPAIFPYKTKVVWSRIEDVNSIDDIVHPSVRETLKFLHFDEGISVHYNGDVPAQCGLGSSSSFTVGFLHALYGLKGVSPEKWRLAEEAIHIEQNMIRENVGSQDQVASAVGGLNKVEFDKSGAFRIIPLDIGQNNIELLEQHMMLFFTGITRHASEVAAEQITNIPAKQCELHAMRQMVDDAAALITERKGDWLADFGSLLNQGWQIKKSLSSRVSNENIDDYYQRAKNAGALGGKLLGAGSGGFLLIFARPSDQLKVRETLSDLTMVPFTFESEGSKVIYRMMP
jgi:D-glycero-alpha-D-manno-heptose-7-phosphate kinase